MRDRSMVCNRGMALGLTFALTARGRQAMSIRVSGRRIHAMAKMASASITTRSFTLESGSRIRGMDKANTFTSTTRRGTSAIGAMI